MIENYGNSSVLHGVMFSERWNYLDLADGSLASWRINVNREIVAKCLGMRFMVWKPFLQKEFKGTTVWNISTKLFALK